jgi:hypothetical protein
MARTLIAVCALAVAGCTTYKLWTEFDADPREGTIQLGYEYRKFENPQVDERAAIETARERCAEWGYKGAQRIREERICLDGTPDGSKGDCSKWRVIRTYRCAK